MQKPLPVAPPDQVTFLPGWGGVENTQFAGYASIYAPHDCPEHDEKLFYWFVGDADYKTRPTILWTNGGPGSSSFWGFFLENGPYAIDPESRQLTARASAWNTYANYMIFEHPLSVTLSEAQVADAIPKTVEQGIDQLYQAFLNFLAMHPEIAQQPIILAGESYAGTYLPLLAQAILNGNKSGKTPLDLRLVVLCDAWVDPGLQMAQDTTWAFTHGLISRAQKEQLDRDYAWRLPEVNAAIQALCGCYMANTAQTGDPAFQPILDYLNLPEVREALHVPLGYKPVTQNWSEQVSNNYAPQVNNAYAHIVQSIMEQEPRLKVRVVSGLNDAKDCNFLGTEAWLQALPGQAAEHFRHADTTQWKNAQQQVIGFMQGQGQLGWLKILNAGHMVPQDQPELIHYIMANL